MITNTVKNITGDLIAVQGLMGPGVDPHLYRARQSDVQRLAHADIIFYNGLHLEGKMALIFEKLQAVALGDALSSDELRPSEFKDLPDPHIWFDVSLWMKTVPLIRDALVKLDPKNANAYKENATTYLKQLHDLDAYVKNQIKNIPPSQRILVTAHDAFGYFGKAYEFQVVGLQGISTDSEPGAKDIHNLAQFIAAKKIKSIFTESSIPQRNIQAVQNAVRALGWEVAIGEELYSDALGNPESEAGSYVGMIKYNVDTIVKALS